MKTKSLSVKETENVQERVVYVFLCVTPGMNCVVVYS